MMKRRDFITLLGGPQVGRSRHADDQTSAKGGDSNVEVSCNYYPCDRAWGCGVAVANARRAGDGAVRPIRLSAFAAGRMYLCPG